MKKFGNNILNDRTLENVFNIVKKTQEDQTVQVNYLVFLRLQTFMKILNLYFSFDQSNFDRLHSSIIQITKDTKLCKHIPKPFQNL